VTPSTILVCNAQVPLNRGGAELHAETLVAQLRERGFRTSLVTIPFKWYPPVQALTHAFLWRMVDMSESNGERIDMVIGTKFPSYLARHENKIIWLIHQFRQIYDLYDSAEGFPKDTDEDRQIRDSIMQADEVALREARHIFTNSRNTASRLKRFNGIMGEPLHVPPPLLGRYRCESSEPYILSVGRLDRLKRVNLLLQALVHTAPTVRAIIVGEGDQRAALESEAERLGLEADRVHFAGRVSDEELVELYARCMAVYYAPVDEDYGLVAVEALLSRKPVITTSDSGGVLEFVDHQATGLVSSPCAEEVGASIDWVARQPNQAQELGTAGRERVRHLNWDSTIERLLAYAP
jgi:glycosyltransferase involved in cell wall biosynthesis